MNKIKAIIFDVDGVLIDSKEANIQLFTSLLEKAGYDRPTKKEILACFHLSLWHSLEKLLKTKDTKEIQRVWDLAIESTANTTHLFKFPKNLKSTLNKLHSEYRLAVVTSRVRTGLERVFDDLDIGQLFETYVTYGDYKHPKPNPEPLLVAMERLGLKPREAVYVGDSITDIEASRAAGMRIIHITNTRHKDADVSIGSLDELPSVLAMA